MLYTRSPGICNYSDFDNLRHIVGELFLKLLGTMKFDFSLL